MQKIIFLVDMNAFFIGCEMARNHELKGKPAAVAGDPKNRSGIVFTANYEARKYNIKTTMTVRQARDLCPEIIFVPPDHVYYEQVSHNVMDILRRYTPIIEQNSIDEAWMDLTGCEGLYGPPIDIAKSIMKDIMDELDLWCSIGIAENKFLAKMASEMKKPLGITEVWQKDVEKKIWPLPVRSMYGIGKQTEKKLESLALYTIEDISKCDIGLLSKTFGKYGRELNSLANGIDPSPVAGNPFTDNKSISRSTTLSKDITDLEYAKVVLFKLAEEVGSDARKSGYRGRTVSIAIKYNDFKSITRQKAISSTYLTRDIYDTGAKLLKENWSTNKPVRLLGIGLGDLDMGYTEQLSLFACDKHDDIKEEKIEKVMDSIREKYGADKIKRAKTIEEKNKHI